MIKMSSERNKKIIKNTLFLYLRMIVVTGVNLFAVRIVLKVLGIDNYGIYTVIGGFVLLFQFLNAGMVATSQRFISYELGRGDLERLKKVFSTSLFVHILLAFVILVFAETFGLWFVNNKLNLPIGRIYAANWVYQCSVIALLITTISVPYNACIVAHEHMKIYGWFGILEAILKLAIVGLLIVLPFDKLILYSTLVMLVYILMRFIYASYCKKNFEECHLSIEKNKELIIQMFSFAGWSFVGNFGYIIRKQGLDIVLNLYFNVALNAAKGIAGQISGVIMGLVNNFQMAMNPQITKRFAEGNTSSMMNLVISGTKFSFLLLLAISIPLYISCSYILNLWLENPPEFTEQYIRLVLIMLLIDSLSGPLLTAMQATGDIKIFNLIGTLIMITCIPVACIWLTYNKNPFIIMYVAILFSVVNLTIRLILLHRKIYFSFSKYLSDVILRIFGTTIIVFIISNLIYSLLPINFIIWIIFIILTELFFLLTSYIIGLSKKERILCISILKDKLHK